MLEIRTGSGNLVLDPKTSIRFSYTYPMFVTDTLSSNVSYHFDLPHDLKGINSKIIGASPYFDVEQNIKKVNCSLIFNGTELDSGAILCKSYGDGKYRAIFYSSIFSDDFADMEMHQIQGLLTPITLGSNTGQVRAKCEELNSDINSEVVFPTIYAPEFYGSANSDFNGFFNLPDEDGHFPYNEIVKEWEEGDPEEGVYETNRYSLLPAFYARAVLRDIFKSQGFRVIGGFLTHSALHDAILLSLKSADKAVAETYLDALVTGSVDSLDDPRYLFSNDYKAGIETTFEDGFSFRLTSKGYFEVNVTDLRLRHVQSIETAYLYIEGAGEIQSFIRKDNSTEETIFEASAFFWYNGTALSNIRVWINKNYEPITGNITITGVSHNTLNRFATSINIGESFKGIPITKMVNSLRKLFGLLIFADKLRNTVQIELATDIIANKNTLDITKWIIGEVEKTYEDSKNYKVSYDYDDTDIMKTLYPIKSTEYSHPFALPAPKANAVIKVKNLFRYLKAERFGTVYKLVDFNTFIETSGSGLKKGEEYKPEIQSVISHADFDKKIMAPQISGEGMSDAFGISSEIKLTILNYLGNKNAGGRTFPMASMGNVDANGAIIDRIKSLRLDGEDGLYKTTLKPMLDIVGNHETISANLFLTPDRLLKIIRMFQSTIDGEIETPRLVAIDGNQFWIKSFDFQISNNGIEASEIKLAKEKYD